jgi:hypothetical protein
MRREEEEGGGGGGSIRSKIFPDFPGASKEDQGMFLDLQ